MNSPFISDVEDIYENYMDYGSMSCQNTFTAGQKARMRVALQSERSSLLSSIACQAVSTSVLPIESIQLSGESKGHAAYLSWEITGEEDNPVFEIENSLNGADFTQIYRTEDYSYLYDSKDNGLVYYRIKYTNQDGTSLYSNVIGLKSERAQQITLYPNPVTKNEIFITFSRLTNELLSWQLFDLNGKEYMLVGYSETAVLSHSKIILPNLSKGVYYLKEANNKISPIRFVKL